MNSKETISNVPGAVIGYTSRGPIRLQAGGSPEGEGNEEGKAVEQTATDQPAKPKHSLEDLPDEFGWVKDLVSELRNESADKRTRAKEAEKARQEAETATQQKEAALKVLRDAGILPSDEEADVKATAEKLTKSQQEARDSKVELAVYKAAAKLEADADAILDSRTFMKSVGELDPSDASFASDLESTIAGLVENNERLRKTKKPVGKSGGDHSVAGGGPRQLTEDDLKNMKPHEIVEARKKGLLRKYLNG